MSKQHSVKLASALGGVFLCLCGAVSNRATADESIVLEQITVTAQRRSENSQQVPVAVTAATSDVLENLGVTGSQSIGVVAPAVTFSPSVGGSRITIRGIGSTGSLGDESANAVYVDGVYFPSLPSLLLSFSNIERLEVLKGPQGTLFGRNASGGVVQVVTKKPSQDAQVNVMLGYGNDETAEGSLYATGGIASNLAADLAVYVQDQNKGWGDYATTGGETYSGEARTARTSWLWTPGDTTSLRFSALYSKTEAPANNGGQILPGESVAGTFGNIGFYNSSADVEAKYEVEQHNYSLNFTQDLNWATLLNIASRDEVTAVQKLDNNYSPGGPNTLFERYSDTWTEELQLQSPEHSRIRWIVGGFYYSNKQGLDPGLTRAPTGALARDLRSFMDTKSWAGFGQATMPLFGATSLTLGARYTHDDHEIQGTILTPASLTVIPSKSQQDTKTTYRVALDHQFTDDVMGYVSYSTGFKSGFFSMTSPADPSVGPQTVGAYELGIKSELLDQRIRLNASAFYYDFSDIQVRTVTNAAAISFFNAAAGKVRGIDTELEAAVTQNLVVRVAATYLDTEYTNFPNSLRYRVDPVTHALLRDTIPIGPANGNDLINAPKLVATLGADYTVPMTWGSLIFNATYNYNDGFFFDSQNRVAQPSYQLVNASVSYLSPSKQWRIRLYGNNLAAEKYFANVDITDGTGDIYWAAAPRTYGLQASWSF